jgi:nitroreductase
MCVMSQIPGALGLTAQQVDGLLRTAGRAPSLHNSQPWQFRISPRAIELYADPARTVPVADPDGREQRLACGAALYNLRLALHGHRIRPTVTILPDHSRPELLAVVRHGGTKEPTPEQTRLLRAIPLWRTNRRPFSAEAVASPEQHALRRAALDEGAWLHLVQDRAQRAALHALLLGAHRHQMADQEFRAELETWSTRPSEQRDGVSAEVGGPTPEPYDRWVMRDFTGDTGHPRLAGKDFEEEPLIAVLTSHLSGTAAEVQVGQALQRVLLTATANGLATSFLSQVVEVPQTREELRRLIGGTRPPQAVLRFGHGWPVAASPRRESAELLAPGAANPT